MLGLSPGAEGMQVEVEVQGQQGQPPPYSWTSRVLGADAMRPGVGAEEEARLLRRCVAFPEAALEFCAGADGRLTLVVSVRGEKEEDSEEEMDDGFVPIGQGTPVVDLRWKTEEEEEAEEAVAAMVAEAVANVIDRHRRDDE